MSDIANVVKGEIKAIPKEVKKGIPIILYGKGKLFLNELRENKKYNLEVSNETPLLKKYFLKKKDILNVLSSFGLENILDYKINVKEVIEPTIILVTRIQSKKGREVKLSRLDKDTYYRLKFYHPCAMEFKNLEFQELFDKIGELEETFGEGRVQYYVAPIGRRK
ncbi:hypothetical protein KAT24_02920 [Candidatus Pacearchaeota archaeon]|nr:hypothetical protein [Candidatus Pacearchaeota archaeon]